jgi:hypothetical protein
MKQIQKADIPDISTEVSSSLLTGESYLGIMN